MKTIVEEYFKFFMLYYGEYYFTYCGVKTENGFRLHRLNSQIVDCTVENDKLQEIREYVYDYASKETVGVKTTKFSYSDKVKVELPKSIKKLLQDNKLTVK